MTPRRTKETLPAEPSRPNEPEVSEEGDQGPSDKVSRGPSGTAAKLVEAEAKRDEYLADLQRLAAEYENYRKRAARDQERLVAHAHERLVLQLLPVLDDLERAAKPPIRDTETDRGSHEEAPPTELDTLRSEYEALVEGVRLVERSLRKALEKEGLVEIETNGSFDPHVHEAILAQPRDDAEPGSVVEVLQRGYRLGDKVVRPARVIVAE